MQLREYLPYDVRHVIAALPRDGDVRDKFRKFTRNPRPNGRARSVLEFAKALGFSVREIDFRAERLPRGTNGRLVTDVTSDNGYTIEVSKNLSVEAKRFALLHEIAHYYRHSDHDDPLPDAMFFDLSGGAFYVDQIKEREANEFAEAVLFGDAQLCAAIGLIGSDIKALARYFGVTENVVSIAVKKLRI